MKHATRYTICSRQAHASACADAPDQNRNIRPDPEQALEQLAINYVETYQKSRIKFVYILYIQEQAPGHIIRRYHGYVARPKAEEGVKMSKEIRKRYCLLYETHFDDFVSYECDYPYHLLSYIKDYDIFNQNPSFTIFVRMPMKETSMILFSYDHGEFKFRDLKEEHQLLFKLILQVFKEDMKGDKIK